MSLTRLGSICIALCAVACASQAVTVSIVDVSSGQEIALSQDCSSHPCGHDKVCDLPASFTGSYFSAQSGTLRLVQSGSRLSGSYNDETDDCRITGVVSGHVTGNLAVLSFVENAACRYGERYFVSGRGRLMFDAAKSGNGAVHLFGSREVRQMVPSLAPRGAPQERFLPSTPWTAVSLTLVEHLSSRGSGQARAPSSPERMALRLVLVAKALHALGNSAPANSELKRALDYAERELARAQHAVELWRHGDPRRYLQIEYCLGPRLRDVEARSNPAPAGLSDLVPEQQPSNWDQSNCLDPTK